MADVEKIIINEQSYPVKDVNAVSVLEQSLTAEQKAQVQANIGVTAATNVYTKSETDTLLNGKISTTAKGASNGVAELDSNGKIPSSQLPSFVDDVIEGYYSTLDDRFYEESTFTTLIEPVAGKSWVDIPANKSYRWTGSVYVRVDEGVQIGETADTAYAGNKGKANADAIAAIKDGVSIDSFSDVETALAGKVDAVQGKGLSTNDYTSEEKTKLAGLENYDDTGIQGDISAIEEVIPSTATSQNQLATAADIPTDAVKYSAQTLTNAQKTQARTNIGAGTSSFSGSYGDLTNAPPLVKGSGTGGDMIGGTGVNQNSTRYTNSVAYGNLAAAIKDYAIAFGNQAFAGTNRGGKHAVAIGDNVRAEKDYEWAIGKCNQSNSDTAFSIGDGTSGNDRHNLMELKADGTLLLNGNAVQTKNLETPLSISGTSQNTVESALGAISKKTSLLADINRNLGTEITAAQKLAIANGTFEDLPIGAYWTLNNTVYRIAHHDYYLGTGDIACTSHHIVVVPDNSMYRAVMNDTNTTTGGYAGSKMRTTNLATALSTFETDFGAAHILNHRILVTNAVSDGQASGWAWADSKVDLMSENMVFGHPVWGKAGYETGIERGQLALFSLYPEYIQKQFLQFLWYWLRSVASESAFCDVSGRGGAYDDGNASYSGGVRPYACIYFDDVL